MKPRLHIGWTLFAVVMAWAVCFGDIPRIMLPHRTAPLHYLSALLNLTAVLGLALYALRRTGTSNFWRVFAPIYALVLVGQIANAFIMISRLVIAKGAFGENGAWVIAAGVFVLLPMLAMTTFTTIALFRLG